jgi:hypothetical protein
MRDLDVVITEMMPIVPDKLKERFSRLLERVPYTPPESMAMRWHEAQMELNRFLPATADKLTDWQRKTLKIWTGKDI